jgi:hypothetical protein
MPNVCHSISAEPSPKSPQPVDAELEITAAATHDTPSSLTQGKLALNHVELLFTHYEHDGMWIECQRQGDAGFTSVGSDTASPWTDTRTVKTPGTPEWRDYRACWWDNSPPPCSSARCCG